MHRAQGLLGTTVEGYRFHRSDGKTFDPSVKPFTPTYNATKSKPSKPNAYTIKENAAANAEWEEEFYHVCDSDANGAGAFTLAHRCEPTWSTLSDQQKRGIEQIEHEVNASRQSGFYFLPVIIEGLGGCGKTRLMAYVMNHSPNTTNVIYLTKQNKRLQDFLHGEIGSGELISPQPVTDMSKWYRKDFEQMPRDRYGAHYACTVEKLVYNMCDSFVARQTNRRDAMQWKMEIPDGMFGKDLAGRGGNTVVLLDEYTMVSPPLLHKTLHCIEILFGEPTVLIMGGDRFQLNPVLWDARDDPCYRGKCGKEAPAGAITSNNEYYVSDIREELTKRLDREPFEYHMVGSQRCRDDPELAKFVVYLRNSCEKQTSIKAIKRRLTGFGRARGINLYRYDENDHKTGRLVFNDDYELNNGGMDDDDEDEDRHLGDYDERDTIDTTVDFNDPPKVDMTPFIEFYRSLYEKIFKGYNDGSLNDNNLSGFVYLNASRFALTNFPVFIVKTNDECNMLSDTFLKSLFNGVYTELMEKYEGESNERGIIDMRSLLEKLCVSLNVTRGSPVQQTLMTGVPFRMTETIKDIYSKTVVVCNGELVLLTGIEFSEERALKRVFMKPLQGNIDHHLVVIPGITKNRLVCPLSEKHDGNEAKRRKLDTTTTAADVFMVPVVPMVCENIYQMQGNTIVSNCFIDLVATKSDDIYVAISRFQKTSCIRGIIL